MKPPIVFAAGCTIFLLGIPLSLASILGNSLIIGGSIILAAAVIAHSVENNRSRF